MLQGSSASLLSDEELGYFDPERGIGKAVELTDANFAWNPNASQPDLKNINFVADAGKYYNKLE